ncbi:hypothetical protein NONI108955_33685 [Nocardia ninae]|uniref:Uncharacterized protein n=1 Tax=Nocardia ninae NBRC 108245 TaxID=1210091 RepID=A0A511M724_9NOCA|nr:hypothetical protein NN4_04270 [Nocardia ninae NBRC 108245]
MSATQFVEIDGRGFWAVDDALGVWLAYLVDQVGDESRADDPWLADVCDQWRRTAAISDFGTTIDFDTRQQRDQVREFARAARDAAVAAGDVRTDQLCQWLILDDIAVSDGHARRPGGVQLNRILEVADGFIALLDGRLPPDPPSGWWFVGTGEGMRVLTRR